MGRKKKNPKSDWDKPVRMTLPQNNMSDEVKKILRRVYRRGIIAAIISFFIFYGSMMLHLDNKLAIILYSIMFTFYGVAIGNFISNYRHFS